MALMLSILPDGQVEIEKLYSIEYVFCSGELISYFLSYLPNNQSSPVINTQILVCGSKIERQGTSQVCNGKCRSCAPIHPGSSTVHPPQ